MARILLIDDDESTLALEQLYLYEEGHETLAATDALMALDYLSLYEFDLVIVDVNMPRLSGFQLVNNIKKNKDFKDVAIAFLTSCHDKDHVTKASELGADLYLVKPISRATYIERINYFMHKNTLKPCLKVEFHDTHPTNIIVHQQVQLVAMTDLGIEVLTHYDWHVGQQVEISNEVFHHAIDTNLWLQVAAVKLDQGELKKVYLTYQQHDQIRAKKIQKYISSRRPSAMMKYPKTR